MVRSPSQRRSVHAPFILARGWLAQVALVVCMLATIGQSAEADPDLVPDLGQALFACYQEAAKARGAAACDAPRTMLAAVFKDCARREQYIAFVIKAKTHAEGQAIADGVIAQLRLAETGRIERAIRDAQTANPLCRRPD